MHPPAQWVALRTFRRRVKRCGETGAGAPIFAMGAVMLIYPPGARHFYPVARCSRCDAFIELPEPILSSTDLDRSGQPHLCQACARGGVDRLARPARPRPDPARSPSPSPASDPDFGDDLDRAETEVAAIVGAAVSRAEEIQTEAVQAAAALLAEAETGAAQLRAAAELEAAIALNGPHAPEDRADVAELQAAGESASEAAEEAQQQARALLAEAEAQAAETRATAEARAAETRAMAEADAARWREAAERSKEQARAILAQAEAQAAEVLEAAAAELDAAVALRAQEAGSEVLPSTATDDGGGDGHEA